MEERLDIVVDSSSAKRGIDVLITSMRSLKDSVISAEGGTAKLFSSLNSGLASIQSHVLGLRSLVVAFGSIITVFKTLTTEMSKFQAFISAMSVSVGGVKEARDEFAFLIDMADRLGISITALRHNYSQLSAAAVNTGIKQEQLRVVFENFSIAARVMHLSTIDTRLMFYALTQMVSKGTVSMEELRRQLGEKLPGAMNIAARSVNATVQDFEAAVRKGIVSSIKFLPILGEEVRRTFIDGLSIASRALDAELNRLNNTWQKIIVSLFDFGAAVGFTNIIKELNRILSDKSIAEEFAKAIKSVSDEVANFLSKITPTNVRDFVTNFGNAITALGTAITRDLLPFLKDVAELMGTIVTAWAVIRGITIGTTVGASVGGPVGAGIGAVAGGGAAVGGLAYIKDKLDRAKARGAFPPVDPGYDPLGRYKPLESQLALEPKTKSTAKLSDVLQAPTKKAGSAGSASAFESFLQNLKERDIASNEESNKFDALREHARSLIKKEPQKAAKLQEAFNYIDRLEGKGLEFKPLIDRLSGMIAHIDQNVPDEIDRLVDAMIAKYPLATEAGSKARELAAIFRKEYGEKKEKEQLLFDEKQNEIIRRLQEESHIYEEQARLLALSNDERDKAIKKLELSKRLEEQIVILRNEALKSGKVFDELGFRSRGKAEIDEIIVSLDALQSAGKSGFTGLQKAVTDYSQNALNDFKIAQEGFTFGMRIMEDALTEMVSTGKISFKSLGDVLVQEITRMIIKINLAKLALDFTGKPGGFGGGFGSIIGKVGSFFGVNASPPFDFSSFFGNASWIPGAKKGLTFNHGNIIPFASGGVVNSPTLFPMRSGAGLMGEDGPEAIMPLSRGKDGKLGVKGGSSGVVINMVVNTPNAESFKQSRAQIMSGIYSEMVRHNQRMS